MEASAAEEEDDGTILSPAQSAFDEIWDEIAFKCSGKRFLELEPKSSLVWEALWKIDKIEKIVNRKCDDGS